MRWKGRRQSTNIEDRRTGGGRGKVVGGGIGVLVIALVVYLLGGDPSAVLQQAGSINQPHQTNTAPLSTKEKEDTEFVSVVLADTEEVWEKLFREMGGQYEPPVLVLYRDNVQSACGGASSATGPFYCPADKKLYIDLSFYDELHNRFGAPGDFAMAYVVAHEVAHHVQNLLGISDKVQTLRSQLNQVEYNKLSVRLELQADFFSGVWAYHADRMNNILQEGDIEEALNAAHAIGDDNLQRKHGSGMVVPDAFTHGTSQQRVYWFKKGFTTGDVSQGDTFAEDAF
ncbi:MAG: neutral zinc metallopeptidase [Flavipsychrobacter sp.]